MTRELEKDLSFFIPQLTVNMRSTREVTKVANDIKADLGNNQVRSIVPHLKILGYLVKLSYVHLRSKENPPCRSAQSERTSSCFMHATAADNGVVK